MADISELSKYIPASKLILLTEEDLKEYLAMLNKNKDNFIKAIMRLGIAKSDASAASSGGGSSASSGGSTRCLGDRCGGHGFIKHHGCCEPCLASMEAADRAKERAAASSFSGGGIRSSIPPPAERVIERVIIDRGIDRGMYIELPRQYNLNEAALHERQRAETIAKYGGIPGEIRYHNGPSPLGPGVHVVHHGAAGMFVQRNPGVHGGGGFPFGVAQINERIFKL